MNDITLLLNLLTKTELANIIQHHSINVQGFQMNVDKAPDTLLRGTLKKELEQGLRPRRRGKKYTDIKKVRTFLASRYVNELEEPASIPLETFVERVEMDKMFSTASALSFLIEYKSDFYREHEEAIKKNINEKAFLLQGIVDEIPVEVKLKRIKTQWLRTDFYRDTLLEIKNSIVEEIGEQSFTEIETQVNIEGETSLTQMLKETHKQGEIPLLVAFLLSNNRYQQEECSPFLLRVMLDYQQTICEEKEVENEELNQKQRRLENDVTKEKQKNEALQKQVQEMTKLREEKEAIKEKLDSVMVECGRLKNSTRTLSREYETLLEQRHYEESIVNAFRRLIQKHHLMFVTNETPFINHPVFNDRIMDFDTFRSQLNGNRVHAFSGNVLCITRISYPNSQIWQRHVSIIKQHEIPYLELSGYDFEAYLEQILEYLQREREKTW